MEIGLFPLGLVLYPGERVPLHIFEPRYRELIGECLDSGAEFGLLLADDDGLREIGTTATVVEVIDRLEDGRLNIVIEGRARFRLLVETSARSFLTGTIELEPDDDTVPSSEERAACLAAFRALAREADAEATEPGPELADVSYWLAMRVDLGTEIRQELLELRSARERTLRVTQLFTRARGALVWQRMARERAAGNGNVQHP